MLKRLTSPELHELFDQVAEQYRLQVPQQLADGTRQLNDYGCGEIAFSGERLQRKPTSYFFPQTELLVTLRNDGKFLLPPFAEPPVALFGLDRIDLQALAFLDRFFAAEPADTPYLRRRETALVIGLTGYAGEQGRFLPIAGGNCDLELIAVEPGWLAAGYSETGKVLLTAYQDAEPQQLRALPAEPEADRAIRAMLQQAGGLLATAKVPDSFWQEVADRCISCSGCNLACPTCSCFCVQDRQAGDLTERSRVWDSCQLDAFMREASGHNPLGTAALRTWRRIHHKLVADVERWGESGCVGCGRCDRACPTGIGMFAVVEELLARFARERRS